MRNSGSGLGLAIAQYVPEITSKIIKLTFHLPINENKILLQMLGFGIVILMACYAIMFLMFSGFSNQYFAKEIVNAAVISVTPWFLAGFTTYFLASLVITEAIWKYRIAYAAIAYTFILLYLEYSAAGGYAPINLKLSILTLIASISILFSAYRFRKGEM